MEDAPAARSRRIASGLFAVGCTLAVAVMLSAQLGLMSVLDTAKADEAAREVAESRFTASLVAGAVERAVEPILDEPAASQIATLTSADPRVQDVIRRSLILAHRQLVTPTSALDSIGGEPSSGSSGTVVEPDLGAAIEEVLAEIGARSGVDLSSVIGQVEPPTVVPDDLPEVDLRTIAERTRIFAAATAALLGIAAVVVHPRPGRALSGLGWKIGVVVGVWLLGLLLGGWLIGLVGETLFGEMLASVWATAVPAMIAVLVAVLVLCVGLWFAGVAVDGFTRSREPARDPGRR
jgi:hypothetical protein